MKMKEKCFVIASFLLLFSGFFSMGAGVSKSGGIATYNYIPVFFMVAGFFGMIFSVVKYYRSK